MSHHCNWLCIFNKVLIILNLLTEVLKLKTALENHVPSIKGESLTGAEGTSDLRFLSKHP